MMAVYRDSLLADTPLPLRQRLQRLGADSAPAEPPRPAGEECRRLPVDGAGAGELPLCVVSQYDLSDSFIATGVPLMAIPMQEACAPTAS